MMRWKFNSLMGKLKDVSPDMANYQAIASSTGIAPSTLSGISSGTKRVDLSVADRLLTFFSEQLDEELTTQDLLEFKPGRGK